jgi:hypothetical protein
MTCMLSACVATGDNLHMPCGSLGAGRTAHANHSCSLGQVALRMRITCVPWGRLHGACVPSDVPNHCRHEKQCSECSTQAVNTRTSTASESCLAHGRLQQRKAASMTRLVACSHTRCMHGSSLHLSHPRLVSEPYQFRCQGRRAAHTLFRPCLSIHSSTHQRCPWPLAPHAHVRPSGWLTQTITYAAAPTRKL